MEEQKTHDEIDLELSRTYFGNAEGKKASESQEKEQQEKAQPENAQHMPLPTRRRWSPVTLLLILWLVSAIVFFAGYILRDKRVIFNVNINIEQNATPSKKASCMGRLIKRVPWTHMVMGGGDGCGCECGRNRLA